MRKMRIRKEERRETIKAKQVEVLQLIWAAKESFAPRRLPTRVEAATLKPEGSMKQRELSVWVILVAATCASGLERREPLRKMMISEAHHSDIMRRLGRPRARKGPHPVRLLDDQLKWLRVRS